MNRHDRPTFDELNDRLRQLELKQQLDEQRLRRELERREAEKQTNATQPT